MTRIKICGITTPEDARLAVSLGAWAVGLVFYEDSARRCDQETAAAIGAELKRRADVVGVFVNAPLDDVIKTAEAASLSMLQFHGEEGPSYCAEARRRSGLKVVKAARVRDAASVRALSAYKTDFHMLDAYVPGRRGGTGERFDWLLAAEHPPEPPLILSGGIDAGNVAEAISAVQPSAIDVSSGVEASSGRKDPEKLRRLFEAVAETVPARV